MQPRPGNGTGWAGKKKANPGMKPVVDPRPKAGRKVPNPGLGADDKIYRTMPITEKQLGAIKKMYGIK